MTLHEALDSLQALRPAVFQVENLDLHEIHEILALSCADALSVTLRHRQWRPTDQVLVRLAPTQPM